MARGAISFWVPGVPVGYDRAAAALRFTPRDVEKWRALVQAAFNRTASKAPAKYLGPVRLEIEAFGARGDIDNVAKEILDALKGHAYRDDCQVVDVTASFPARKLGKGGGVCKPKEQPGVNVRVVYLDTA